MDLLDGKVCIITGAGKGIGRECATLFARHGAKLALITRTESDFASLLSDIDVDPSRILTFSGDVSDEKTVIAFIQKTISKFGRIDALVNNAGIRFRKSFVDITYEEWNNVMMTNAGSTFLFCQHAGKEMIRQKSGKIINMASVIGTGGLADLAGYGASKGAIISLTKCLAIEWAEHNINVNVIAPGFCETSYAESFKEKTDLYNFTIERTPKRKWGKGVDVANACLFLASDLSDYITGETLSVDGGWSAW